MEFFPFIVIVAGLGIGLALLSRHREKQRIEAWRAMGASLGLEYRQDGRELLQRFSGLKLFKHGHTRWVTNLLVGRAGSTAVALADYRYVVGHGKHRHVYELTICVLDRDRMRLPNAYLRRERALFDAIGQLFGGQDIDFKEDSRFSGLYVLQGQDPEAARALFDAPARRWFVDHASLDLQVETYQNSLLLAVRRLKPEPARQLIDRALELVTMWSERYERWSS